MKPRRFHSSFATGTCDENDGERVVDARADIYDSRHGSKDIKRFADWLKKAVAWLEEAK